MLKMFNLNKICEKYNENSDTFTVLHAWNYRELSGILASGEPATVCEHVRVAQLYGYPICISGTRSRPPDCPRI